MEIAAVLDFQVNLLEAAVTDDAKAFQTPLGRAHLQAALRLPPDLPPLEAGAVIVEKVLQILARKAAGNRLEAALSC